MASVDLLWGSVPSLPPTGPLAAEAARELAAYWRDSRHPLTFPCELQGTGFQLRVWQALRSIPPGETLSYGELARRLGSSPRAIGGACRANPIPFWVPCHRIVARDGLGGFSGTRSGRETRFKEWLLRREAHHGG